MTPEGTSRGELERLWREIDSRLNKRELDIDAAIRLLIEGGAVRKAVSDKFQDVPAYLWFLEPAREVLVPGPRLLLDYGDCYGGPRIYRPVSDQLRLDTGLYS